MSVERDEPVDVLVVGGGLASIDVVKVLMLETTRAELAGRGIEIPMIDRGGPSGIVDQYFDSAQAFGGLSDQTLHFQGLACG